MKDANTHELIQYICDYNRLSLCKEDFMKRKRVKNAVHLSDRCCAKRSDGEQCTRRKKADHVTFCGTHLKGTPHGVYNITEEKKQQINVAEIDK